VSVTRRALLQIALIEASSRAFGAQVASVASAAVLIVCDRRVTESAAFAKSCTTDCIDVAQDIGERWRRLRRWSGSGPVSGLTRWSDYVQVRGLLQERGLRLRHESRRGALIRWDMA
jgi:hypothetical protein